MDGWKVDNPKEGLRQLGKLLQDLKIKDKVQALFCLEHTGIYNHILGGLQKQIPIIPLNLALKGKYLCLLKVILMRLR